MDAADDLVNRLVYNCGGEKLGPDPNRAIPPHQRALPLLSL